MKIIIKIFLILFLIMPMETFAQGTIFGAGGARCEDDVGLCFSNNGRVRDTSLGMFMQPDSSSAIKAEPVRLNRYAYAGQNPMNNIDPSGDFFFAALGLALVIGAAFGPEIYSVASNSDNIDSVGDVAKYAALGTATGFTSAVIGGTLAGLGGLNLAQWTLGGAAVGAIGSAINGSDVGQGALGGAIGGFGTWAGGSIMAQKFFGAGAIGNLVSSGGISSIENSLQGRDFDVSYLIHVGPLAISLEKGLKPQYGISSITNVYYLAKNIIGPQKMRYGLTLSSGTPVFSTVKPYGNTEGNVVRLGSLGQSVTDISSPKFSRMYKHKQYVLGHELIHANLQGRLGAGLGGVSDFYNVGGDINSLTHGAVFNFGGYNNDPFESGAYAFPAYGY